MQLFTNRTDIGRVAFNITPERPQGGCTPGHPVPFKSYEKRIKEFLGKYSHDIN